MTHARNAAPVVRDDDYKAIALLCVRLWDSWVDDDS